MLKDKAVMAEGIAINHSNLGWAFFWLLVAVSEAFDYRTKNIGLSLIYFTIGTYFGGTLLSRWLCDFKKVR